ncbi:hypothetical protein HOY82DRAFT_571954, partial [Tuber indicum]
CTSEPWSQSAASLESILSVLNGRDHFFVQARTNALNWMGVPVCSGYIMDILVRASQVGEWLEVDKYSVPGLAMLPESGEQYSVGWFKRYDDQWYICLCTEDNYRLTVDTEKIQVPHPINFNSTLAGSEFHPYPKYRFPHYRSSLPYLITYEDVNFVWVRNTEHLAEYFIERQQRQERRLKRIAARQEKHVALYGRTLGPNVPFILQPL